MARSSEQLREMAENLRAAQQRQTKPTKEPEQGQLFSGADDAPVSQYELLGGFAAMYDEMAEVTGRLEALEQRG
ncbi:hypothetical protein [uncultured Nocardioides sp.]|uniref:Uncharacterized protein n=1 Tax=uncultured Nocardioides sp. TaxID=198441 RepID=A0A6J4NYK5_9ACTN|nr:hypothetical protein [uncultured Nocardioides sp.]CAA9400262.1 MAG: hypothetical protein AVDCRST_MAG06-2129 [uncultured Nocardioides sp.]